MRSIGTIVLLLGIGFVVASCSTVEADLARSKALCTDVGYPPDTDQWRDCVLDLEVAWRHGRYRSLSSQEDQQRFCTDLGFKAGSDDHRFCIAELLAAAAHGHAAGVLYDDRDRCKELGFVADTDAFRRCVVTFEVARRHRSSGGARRR